MGGGGGRGMGCGRGMGGGGGRGMGMRTGGGTVPTTPSGNTAPAGGADEVSGLRQAVQQMTHQLGEVLERLRKLENG
jgi:hypothetical protein